MTIPKPRAHWCGTCGMLLGLMDQMVVEFKKLPREEQERTRKEIYERMTGKPYRPDATTKET